MPALTRTVTIAWSFGKQADIATPQVAANMFAMTKLDLPIIPVILQTESNALEYGKINEWATQVFKTNWDVSGRFEMYASSHFAAWVSCFGLGHVTKSGAGPYTYTTVPLLVGTDGLELPYFTYAQKLTEGGGSALDQALVGCAIESWELQVQSGPGRAASKFMVEFVGSGKYVSPSTITLPAPITVFHMPSASLAFSVAGVDYVANKNIISLRAGMKNNLRLAQGFFPGSGAQTAGDNTSGAIRGRIEIGDRTPSLSARVRLDSASAEFAKVVSQATGTATITLTYNASNQFTINWKKVSIRRVEQVDDGGIAALDFDCECQYDATNGLISTVATCPLDGIAQ